MTECAYVLFPGIADYRFCLNCIIKHDSWEGERQTGQKHSFFISQTTDYRHLFVFQHLGIKQVKKAAPLGYY